MPQYSAWLEAVRYVCTSCVLPAFNDAYCHVPVTEWYQHYLPCYLLPVSNSGLLFFHVDLPGCTVAYWFTQYQISDVAENLGRYFLYAVYRSCEWFGIILTVKVETRHFIEGYFGSEFWAICNHCGVMTANNFCTRCVKIFKILFRTFSPHRRSTLFCSNFVKSFRREISEIVCYLLHQKNPQNFGCLSNCRYCADCAQSLPGPAPNNVLTVLQISSKSVHFRWSYSRMREHCFLPSRIIPL